MTNSSIVSCKQPAWPAERDFAAYDLMSGGILGEMVRTGKLTSSVVVDIGPGRFCSALKEMASKVEGIIPYAIAPHHPEIIPAGITFYRGALPDEDFPIKNAQLITDIFAGVSYAMRKDSDEFVPSGLEVLIRLAGWLKPGGVLIAYTEVKRLGTHEDHVRISHFFRKYMSLVCLFEIYEKFAEGNQVIENQLRVIVRNEQTVDKLERRQAYYRDLVELAKRCIGQPSRGEVLWESKEENPALRMRIYETIFVLPDDEKEAESLKLGRT